MEDEPKKIKRKKKEIVPSRCLQTGSLEKVPGKQNSLKSYHQLEYYDTKDGEGGSHGKLGEGGSKKSVWEWNHNFLVN